jgi:hypothetical protein
MSLAREPGDLEGASLPMVGDRQPWEGDKPQATERAYEESDAGIVPRKPAKTWVTPVELVEGRAAAKGRVHCTKRAPGTGRDWRAHESAADRRTSKTETKGEVDQPAQSHQAAAADRGVSPTSETSGSRSG